MGLVLVLVDLGTLRCVPTVVGGVRRHAAAHSSVSSPSGPMEQLGALDCPLALLPAFVSNPSRHPSDLCVGARRSHTRTNNNYPRNTLTVRCIYPSDTYMRYMNVIHGFDP